MIFVKLLELIAIKLHFVPGSFAVLSLQVVIFKIDDYNKKTLIFLVFKWPAQGAANL